MRSVVSRIQFTPAPAVGVEGETMRTNTLGWLLFSGVVSALGCSTGQETPGDTVFDVGVDSSADTSIDTGPTCTPSQTVCGDKCKDLTADRENCGECGKACDKGLFCVAGKCAVDCIAGTSACDGKCVSTATDNANCGACGTKCAAGEVCSGGKCALSCAAPLTECGGGSTSADAGDASTDGSTGSRYCANTKTDRENCGACGTSCKAGEICTDGVCKLSCGAGLSECSGSCRDLKTDVANCGTCGTKCAAGEVCTDGACKTSCGTGLTECSGKCTNVSFDPLNCGTCGTACATGESCVSGTCKIVCPTEETNCSGVCKKTASDLANCGACGNACPVRSNASSTCTTGSCGFTCNTNFGDCDKNAANGCESNLTNDPNNCGGCGTVCPGGVCSAGKCGAPCYTGTPRVLVYGPGGTAGTAMFTGGSATVTVASATQWAAMTTADFGQYDVIWIDGASCGGSMTSVYGTAETNVATWGPAVRGRIVLISGDPDLHGGAAAVSFFNNSVQWLKGQGRNADGGRTGLFMSWGCTQVTTPYAPGAAGSPEKFASVLGTGITGNATNFCAASTTTAGSTHPVLAGITSYWGCPTHGGFTTLPTTFTTLATNAPGGTPVIAARETPIACIP